MYNYADFSCIQEGVDTALEKIAQWQRGKQDQFSEFSKKFMVASLVQAGYKFNNHRCLYT